MHTIFVTGGAGFIGSSFVLYVLRQLADIRVIVFDKLTYAGNVENLAEVWHDPRFTFIQGDICDPIAVDKAMQSCDVVVHFAAETHVDRSILDAAQFVHTDVEGTRVLLEAARKHNVARFLHISTNEVYGNALAPDGSSRPSLETDALRPLSPYAASKAGADCLAYSYWITYGLPVVVTRCSNNYGPRQYPEKQLPLFITNALAGRPLPIYGNGQHTRDWILVADHCSALLTILTAPLHQVLGEVFNIGTGEERTILDNAHAVLAALHLPQERIRHIPDRLGHGTRLVLDASKLRQRLNWQPRWHFQEGLEQTIAWYRDNPLWVEHVLARCDAFLERAMHSGSSEIQR